jgi:c-di-GMP-binding flagellar brake protein YcgR
MRPVTVEVLDGAARGTYRSRVLDFTDGAEILIGALLDRGQEVVLEPGTALQLTFARSDGLHVLSTRLLGRTSDQPSLRLAWPDQTEQVERRGYPRAEVLARCEIQDGDAMVPAMTSNLGAGGVLVTLPRPLRADTQVRIKLDLPELGERTCEAHVARVGEVEGAADNHRYWAGLEFVGLLQSVRDDLMDYVSEIERGRTRQRTG